MWKLFIYDTILYPRALTILQRGLEFIPLSSELWMSYLSLFAEVQAHNKDFEEILRQYVTFYYALDLEMHS